VAKDRPATRGLEPDPHAEGAPTTAGGGSAHGYLGRDPEGDRWRLYLDSALTSYLQFEPDAVSRTEKVEAAGGAPQSTRVFFKPGVTVRHVRVNTTSVPSEFLRGVGAPGAPIVDRTTALPATLTGCLQPQSLPWGTCHPSMSAPCITTYLHACGPSLSLPCPSAHPWTCAQPSINDNCPPSFIEPCITHLRYCQPQSIQVICASTPRPWQCPGPSLTDLCPPRTMVTPCPPPVSMQICQSLSCP